ncbi:hypothetical protein [Streptomyces djakartensis]|uniref:Uncharacterized protein n=1 Tax=Streptomyces djakartensis TaxID=68193 RepID=A0ABQ2Z2U6_9ACTN|nr:hypothetical protein [Streptomyces djakartensis]GGY01483.1 hypothetical protein GCM10010384_01350 [Streptomyces djakartensis]
MKSPLRGTHEHESGTRDFDPDITRTRLVRAVGGAPESEPREDAPEEGCASLYDAIRDMGLYGAKVAAEGRGNGGEGLRL